MNNNILVPELCLIDLNKYTVDLMQIQNRHFMYHPSGLLLLGSEDMVNTKGLFKSHAEEHYEAEERFQIKLPPYDEFLKGWIGVGKGYPYGIVHFAPSIPSGHVELFDKAFSFVEVVQENGFSYYSVLRGFPGKWEQSIAEMLGKEPPLEEKIRKAHLKRSSGQLPKLKLNKDNEDDTHKFSIDIYEPEHDLENYIQNAKKLQTKQKDDFLPLPKNPER